MKILRLKQIIGDKKKGVPALLPIGKTTFYKGIKEGFFPKPVQLSRRAVGWRESEILDMIDKLSSRKKGEVI